jgi:hypothetical protein
MNSVSIRTHLVETFRRDLIGPNPDPDDADLATERLNENPSRWYLAGFLAPADDDMSMNAPEENDDPSAQEERENQADLVEQAGAGGAAGDQPARSAEQPAAFPAILDRPHGTAAARCHRNRGEGDVG